MCVTVHQKWAKYPFKYEHFGTNDDWVLHGEELLCQIRERAAVDIHYAFVHKSRHSKSVGWVGFSFLC